MGKKKKDTALPWEDFGQHRRSWRDGERWWRRAHQQAKTFWKQQRLHIRTGLRDSALHQREPNFHGRELSKAHTDFAPLQWDWRTVFSSENGRFLVHRTSLGHFGSKSIQTSATWANWLVDEKSSGSCPEHCSRNPHQTRSRIARKDAGNLQAERKKDSSGLESQKQPLPLSLLCL